MSILQNEKYKGDSLQQKNFTVDFLSKKVKRNEGEVQQFYVENSHPAIISPEVFSLVQVEIKRRRAKGKHHTGLHALSGKIVCGECGGFFSPKTWHSNSKYKRTVWQCNDKYKTKGKCSCQTPHLYEADIHEIFIQAFNQVYQNKAQLVADYTDIIQVLTDTATVDHESEALREECRIVAEMIQKCVDENARIAHDQREYHKRYTVLHDRYDAAKTQLDKIHQEAQEQASKREVVIQFLADLEQQSGLLADFDEQLWYATVEAITVHSAKDVRVTFKDGSIVQV